MKKLVALLLVFVLIFAFSVSTFAADFYGVADFYKYTEPNGQFYWATNDLKLAVASEIVGGYPANPPTAERSYDGMGLVTAKVLGPLMPENTLSRAEFASMLARALGLNINALSNPFSDVKSSDWYYNPVSELVNKNIIPLDYYNGKLNPNGKITREEIAIWLANAATSYQVPLKNVSLTFKDYSNTSRYAPAVADAVGLKIVGGYGDGTFRPKTNATRAEAIVMLMRLMRLLPCDLTENTAKNVIVNAEQTISKLTQAWAPTFWDPNATSSDGKKGAFLSNKEHNPKLDAALSDFQNTAKDYITSYNLYPETEATVMHDDLHNMINNGTYKEGFLPNMNTYFYSTSRQMREEFKVSNHTGPNFQYYGIRAEYGVVDSVLLRGAYMADGSYMLPFESYFFKPESYKILGMTTMGNIASVSYQRDMKYDMAENVIGSYKTVIEHALLVKQDGKWKVAAYDSVYNPQTRQWDIDWLASVKNGL